MRGLYLGSLDAIEGYYSLDNLGQMPVKKLRSSIVKSPIFGFALFGLGAFILGKVMKIF